MVLKICTNKEPTFGHSSQFLTRFRDFYQTKLVLNSQLNRPVEFVKPMSFFGAAMGG